MGTKRAIARNVAWNWAGMATQMLAGFVVMPFLVHRLGDSGYGLWTLIASLTGYFALLDLGVRGSVGRNMAFHRARGDVAGVSAILSTAVAILCGVAALGLLCTGAVLVGFFLLFDVPPDQVASVRIALLLVGLNLALTFPFSVFDATLWSMQRFDVLNAIDIPTVVLRAGLTFLLIGQGHGLVALAVITLVVTLLSTGLKVFMSFRLDRELSLAWRHVSRAAAKCLFGYGVWYFLLSVARLVTPQVGRLVAGSQLAVGAVTGIQIPSQLLGYATSLLNSATGVLTPVMTSLHAEEKQAQQRHLFLNGGRLCLGAALFFLTWFTLLGKPFLDLWVGAKYESTHTLLVVLVLGELLPMSQWVAYSMILGMNKHKLTACLGILENVAAVTLALLLAKPYGLFGICVAVAAPGTICRGIVQLVYACRLVQLPLATYARSALLPAVLLALPPAAVLFLLLQIGDPTSWLSLFACTLAFGLVYVLGWGIFLCESLPGRERTARIFRIVWGARAS